MKKLVVPIIVNYNMPERADALARKLMECEDTEVVLVDNGSDLMPVADNTTLILPKNVQTTGGWLEGVNIAQKMYHDIFAFMFVITSAEIMTDHIVESLREVLEFDHNAVGVHPALTEDSTTAWKHMITRGGSSDARRTWMIDNICSMYRADWWIKHPFDPELIYAWGIDLETCYLARREGMALYIDEASMVRKVSNIGYTMDRMNMTAEERQNLARANMIDVLQRKYGISWRDYMKAQYIEDYMR